MDTRPLIVIVWSPYELALLGGSSLIGLLVATGAVTSGSLRQLVSEATLRLFGLLLAGTSGTAFVALLKGNALIQRAMLLPLATVAAVYSASLFATGSRGTLAGCWVALHVIAHSFRWYQLQRHVRRASRGGPL